MLRPGIENSLGTKADSRRPIARHSEATGQSFQKLSLVENCYDVERLRHRDLETLILIMSSHGGSNERHHLAVEAWPYKLE